MNDALIEHWFTYHDSTPDQIPKYKKLREAAKAYAKVANRLSPDCADKTAAFRQLRLVNMAFNQTLATNPAPGSDGH